MGPYCQFCGRRCFVERQAVVAGKVIWAGVMATCSQGKAQDRSILSQDADNAHNSRSG